MSEQNAAISDMAELQSPPRAAASTGTRSLKSLAIRGAVWTIAGFGLGQVVRLASNLILAKLLFPEAFGVMALVSVVLAGLQMFSDVGIGPSIIQSKHGNDPAFINTAWTIQSARGVMLWLICCALAYPVASFYAEPQLAALLPVAGFTAVIAGFNSPSLFLLNRDLALGRLTIIELVSQVASVAVMVGWAWLWPSVWALVAGGLVGAILKLIASHQVLPGAPCRLTYDRGAAKALFSFGRWIFLSTVLTFLVGQADRLIFGKLTSMEMLGVYSIAATLALLPRQIVQRVEGALVFPAYSRIVREQSDLRSTFHRVRAPLVIGSAALVTLLVCAGQLLIGVLYDSRYADAGWILQLLSIALLFQVMETMNGAAILALGRPSLIAFGNVTKLIGLVVGVPLGWWWAGLAGAIIGMVCSDVIRYAVSAALVQWIGLPVVRADALVLAGTGLVVAVVFALTGAAVTYVSDAWARLALVALGAAALWSPALLWVGRMALRPGQRAAAVQTRL